MEAEQVRRCTCGTVVLEKGPGDELLVYDRDRGHDAPTRVPLASARAQLRRSDTPNRERIEITCANCGLKRWYRFGGISRDEGSV